MRLSTFALLSIFTFAAVSQANQYLVKLHDSNPAAAQKFSQSHSGFLQEVSREGNVFLWTTGSKVDCARFSDALVESIEPNRPIRMIPNPSIANHRAEILEALAKNPLPADDMAYPDNPPIQAPKPQTAGADPLLEKAWGIFSTGANKAWEKTPQGKDIVVAVTDTGVDYNHEDLINNIWHNKGEIPDNNIDDDNNGYIDDIIGWDFASNDNKPYDLSMDMFSVLLEGGNPGHGTHCAGVIGARLNNGFGTAGVAPQVQIMPLRFLTEKGHGDTAGAIKAIDYAVKNGANIISASWGGEGEDESDKVLRDAIQRAKDKGVLFIAAAGNGREGVGYDNDNDPKPSYPATYPYENIISVAAIDSTGALAKFSNWGNKTVKLGAPGVKILSTVPGNKYQDTVIDLGGIKVTWDGTSMATPFVSGAAAVIWSQNKAQTWEQVRNKLLSTTSKNAALAGKTVTEGSLSLHSLVN